MKLEEIGFYTLSEARAKSVYALHHPLWRCELLITPRCNFKCPYCRGTDMPGDIDLEEAKDIIHMWSLCELKNIRFSGGEPTLHPYLPLMVQYAKTQGIERIAISTNGSAPIEQYKELVRVGANDFSVSLDACCAATGAKMCGVDNAWDKTIAAIKFLAANVYTTVGIVLTPRNVSEVVKTIELAHDLGVADIRVIPAAQNDMSLGVWFPDGVLGAHPILRYRLDRFNRNLSIRGLDASDCKHCHLVRDDMAVMNWQHYPCIIYLREGGKPIGKVGPNMMLERGRWAKEHDCLADPICSKNCLDVCAHYNRRAEYYATETTP